MSVNVEQVVIDPGEDDLLEPAWALKERIRAAEGVLRQQRGFFTRAYRRATTYAYRDREADTLIGFASVRRDGYILFLAVAPEHRGQGFGGRLVATVAEQHRRVSCHARTSNGAALGFYEALGFERVRRIDNYYEDGGAAFYLRLGEGGLADRLSNLLRR
ncbi:MAG: N-acetyltransferase [Halobacteriales archaeon]|nr:N-acetyltransferase [Halobacteriales archaeon]